MPPVQDAWRRFVQLYTPLLLVWARRLGTGEQESPDLVQDVFLVLAREMPAFRHEPGRRFRGWLWTILVNKWRDQLRRSARAGAAVDLGDLSVPDNVEEASEEEHRAYLVARAIELMRTELSQIDWQVCQAYILEGRPAGEVARELGVTINQVYLVKSRILRRLRAELDGLLD